MTRCLNILILIGLASAVTAQDFKVTEIRQWEERARRVTITRDQWGIPHVFGPTDADAVFGLMYAQCEDDFPRVERNYIEKLGRLAEIEGESSLFDDLFLRMIIDSSEAKADYQKSPDWLKKLLQAHADGINYYLHRHPEQKPSLLHRFQPWYPLLWTDGSIGAINTGDITERDVEKLYTTGDRFLSQSRPPRKETADGSNGFAIAPSRTASGKALLYINPHVSFYFRPEVHVRSNEGLQVYGAVTWGQFFIYQGFNAYCGWMHTSGDTDVADLYALQPSRSQGREGYLFDGKHRDFKNKEIRVRYLKGGTIQERSFVVRYTHHGPVMAKREGRLIAVRSYNRSLNSLLQSWTRTKARGFEEFKNTMDLRGNTSNNTVYADRDGHIAYWHGNFVPRRDPSLNWNSVVDGSVSATEWKGLHSIGETVHVYDPHTGWIQNCNSTPFTVSGSASPAKNAYPAYMAPDAENFRGILAARLLAEESSFTIDKLIAAGYHTKLTFFEQMIPALGRMKTQLRSKPGMEHDKVLEAIDTLTSWDLHTAAGSVATTLAIEWASKLLASIQRLHVNQGEADQVALTKQFAGQATLAELIPPLESTLKQLEEGFGTWKVPWGELNRYQRVQGSIEQVYRDNLPSLPVGLASGTWGCLPSFDSKYMPGTKKRYGYYGNSFVCAVEFGERIRARSLLAGGLSNQPASPHFSDQAIMYTSGKFKEVLFYPEEVEEKGKRTYHPGE